MLKMWLQTILQSHSNKNSTGFYRHKNIHEDQWNRIKDPDSNPHREIHVIFDKGTENMHWRKNKLFNKLCRKNWISTCKRLKLDSSLSPCTSSNWKWIKNHYGGPKTVKPLQEKQWNI
jgi:hypothetical protein